MFLRKHRFGFKLFSSGYQSETKFGDLLAAWIGEQTEERLAFPTAPHLEPQLLI